MSEHETVDTGVISLARCKATCHICGAVKFQIDSSRERAAQVVMDAMERHFAEEHPDICADCGHEHTADGCTGTPTASDDWAGVTPAACDCNLPTDHEESA